ncbi:MAG: hypothetical protein PVF43_07420 [Candidatus Eiseniibacteriota bacterium]|jgi:hypothetical protein
MRTNAPARRPVALAVAAIVLLALAIAPDTAAPRDTHYTFLNLSQSPASSIAPAIAHTLHPVTGASVLMVAWLEDGIGVATCAIVDGEPGPIVMHGLGAEPELDGGDGEVALVYTHNDGVVVRRWDAGGWSTPDTLRSGAGVGTAAPDITYDLYASPEPELFVVWSDLTTTFEADVWFSRTVLGAWRTPEHVNAGVPGYTPTPSPQVQPTWSSEGWVPRVYWLANDFDLRHRERLAAGWTLAEGIDGYFGVRMEVASGPDGLHHIVSNGPQPTCPCNIVVYCPEVGDDWGPIEQLTVDVAYYDLASFPNVAVGQDGRVHAFWHQRASDEQMQWVRDDLFYKRRVAYNQWIDDSHLLDGHAGGQPDFCLDANGIPAFVSVEELGNREVIAAIYIAGTAVEEPPAVTPVRPRVVAAPNPFRTWMRLTLEDAPVGDARVEAVDIIDATGRCVSALPIEAASGASGTVARWDGRRADGSRCAAGVYWWRMTRGDGRHAEGPIVLLR